MLRRAAASAFQPTPAGLRGAVPLSSWRWAMARLRLELGGYRRVRGGVTGYVRAVTEEGTAYSDDVKLSSSTSRDRFVKRLRAKIAEACPPDSEVEAQLLRLLDEAEAYLATDPAPDAPGLAEDEDRVEDYVRSARGFEVVRIRVDGGSTREVRNRLSNFTAQVIEEISVDDGSGDVRRYFVLEGKLQGRPLPRLRIDAGQFGALGWVTDQWGVEARVMPGSGVRECLRDCIQAFSADALRRTTYNHTGWTRIEGRLVFLTATGAIGADGVVDGVEVELEGKLSGYQLPPPPGDDELIRAIRTSWDAWHAAIPAIAAPVLGTIYSAPLAEWLHPDFTLWLRGHSGVLKSSFAAVALSHFGPWDWKTTPANWEATANWIEKAAFRVKDLPFLVDDFRPPADRNEGSELRRKAARLLRAAGNRTGRGRMRADTSLRPEYFPRGIVVATAEEQAPGESTAARVWDVPVRRGDIDPQRLGMLQADPGMLGSAASGYIRYIAGRFGDEVDDLTTVFEKALGVARSDGGHLRHPQTFAHLLTGWLVFAGFAVETGAVTNAEASARLDEVVNALRAVAALQMENAERVRPDATFIATLGDLLAGERAHLCNTDGGPPEDARRWGWKAVDDEDGPECSIPRAVGDKVGWVDRDVILLIPGIAKQLVTRALNQQGESFIVSAQALHEALERAGFLIPGNKGLRHNHWVEGCQHNVIRLDKRRVLAAWGAEESL